MKAEKILTGMIICTVLVITGCSKDKEEGNYFIYDGVEYPLNAGVMQFYGQLSEGAGFNFDISLFSSDITFDSDLGGFDGTGHMMYFEMFSSAAAELANGDYIFDLLASENPLTFDKGHFGMNLNFDIPNGFFFNIASGKVTVSGSGSEYEFSLDGFTLEGEAVTGHFKGVLSYYDWSSGKK